MAHEAAWYGRHTHLMIEMQGGTVGKQLQSGRISAELPLGEKASGQKERWNVGHYPHLTIILPVISKIDPFCHSLGTHPRHG